MSDRVKAITVILERDNREEDIEALCQAIMLFQGVASVTKQIVTSNDHIARVRIKQELTARLYEVLTIRELIK